MITIEHVANWLAQLLAMESCVLLLASLCSLGLGSPFPFKVSDTLHMRRRLQSGLLGVSMTRNKNGVHDP